MKNCNAGNMSLLDAAYDFLKSTGVPMTAQEILDPILKAGLWSSTGKTPAATLAARIYMDIKKNGSTSRFVKVGKGKFALSGRPVSGESAQPSLFDVPDEGQERMSKSFQTAPAVKSAKVKVRPKHGPGFVYIMTNPSFKKNWIKIGYTRDVDETVEQRRRELSGSSVPFPFAVYATLKCKDAYHVEQRIHAMIDRSNPKSRLNDAREFYDMSPENGFAFLSEVAGLLAIEENVTRYKDNKPVLKGGKKVGEDAKHRPNTTFTMLGIHAKEKLTFVPTGVKVTVVNDKQIEFAGKLYSLSGFCKAFMPKGQRCESNAYQGPSYFTYQGEVLTKMRESKGL